MIVSGSAVPSKDSTRYSLLDTIRGGTILSMIAYHLLWDLVYLARIPIPWYHGRGAYLWQQSICLTFILLSGFCWRLGRHPLKRGLMVFGSGWLITIVTLFLMPENRILFGILTLIGSCTILMIPIDHLLQKINRPALLGILCLLSLCAFFWLHPVWNGYPKFSSGNLFTAYLGIPPVNFYSADYFPLFPWFLLFLSGYLFHRIGLWGGLFRIPLLKRTLLPSLSCMGRHSLLIYLLHQPLLYGITMLVRSLYKLF